MDTLAKMFVVFSFIWSVAFCAGAAMLYTHAKGFTIPVVMSQNTDAEMVHARTMGEKEAEIAELTVKLTAAMARISAIEGQLAASLRSNTEWEQKYNGKAQDFSNLERQFTELNTSHTMLVRVCEDLKTELSNERKTSGKLRKELSAAQGRKD